MKTFVLVAAVLALCSFNLAQTACAVGKNQAEAAAQFNFATHFANGTQTATDGSIALLHGLNLPKHSSQTVTVVYKGM